MRLAVVFTALLALLAGPVLATPPEIIVEAKFAEPTGRYDHGILGDAIEWGALILTVDHCLDCEGGAQRQTLRIRLPQNRVFEDLTPRLIKDEHGLALVMVVETDLDLGARLALYDQNGLHAATPFIGRSHRWLAPIGAADMDGDGFTEIAYIDRPHLAKQLRVWRLVGSKLRLVAEMDGLTNHRIGWDHIPGGLIDCGTGYEMVVATGDWQRVISVRFTDDRLIAQDLAPYESPRELNRWASCAR